MDERPKAVMPPTCYPIALVLDGKPVLVVGGGKIADEKLDALLLAGADITVVSPTVQPRIAAFAAAGKIILRQREYQPADLDGVWLVIAATDDRALNARGRHRGACGAHPHPGGRRHPALRLLRRLHCPPRRLAARHLHQRP